MTITNRDDYGARGMLFMDKGWDRKPNWGVRTYEFMAPNYRMPEILGSHWVRAVTQTTAHSGYASSQRHSS